MADRSERPCFWTRNRWTSRSLLDQLCHNGQTILSEIVKGHLLQNAWLRLAFSVDQVKASGPVEDFLMVVPG